MKINNYYERIGYGGQVPTHVKDINLDAQTGALTLTIQEGLVVKNIIIGGDPLLPPPYLLPHLTLKPGGVYSDAVRDADYKALENCSKTSSTSRSETSKAESCRRRSTSRPARRT